VSDAMRVAVAVAVADGVALVTVDNPPVNALSNTVLDALAAVAEQLAADDGVRTVVLTGAGDKAFLAGADLDEFGRALQARDQAWIEDHTARSSRALAAWDALPQPVVAAVQASAMGGGLEVALTADLLVADPQARFGLPEVRLGLMPGAGGTQRLPRRIGTGPALDLALSGSAIDAERALALGLITRIAAPGAALDEARALAARLAALSVTAVRAIKANVRAATGRDLAAGLAAEHDAFLEVFASADAREGVRAFTEKRPPHFGR